METVVLIIMLMVSLSFVLKLTWHSPVGAAVTAALAALFVFFAQDAATAQSKTRIADVLADPALMLDISVVLTVDVAFQLLFCFLKARSLGSPLPRAAKAVAGVCLWVPGLLIFPVLFALLVEIIFSMPGADFTLVAASTAAAAPPPPPAAKSTPRLSPPLPPSLSPEPPQDASSTDLPKPKKYQK